jgi:hypothetical protein
MGSTGATTMDVKAVPPSSWEGALSPTLVESKDLYSRDSSTFLVVEEISCGMHHVAAIASLPSSARSSTQAIGLKGEGGRRTRLLTWGKGVQGQLGNEGLKDRSMPQPVPAVEGKRILQVSCGGHHTLVVCEHDPRDARSAANPLSSSTR